MTRANVRQVVRAYLISIAIWCTLSLLTGWQYRIFDEQLNIHSTLWDMILLAESRGFAFALLTPPIFYLVRRYGLGLRSSPWYLWLAYLAALGPFMILYACLRWLVLPPWDPSLQAYIPRTGHGPFELIHQGFADQITIYIALLVAAHAYEYFERVRRQELERYDFQRALAASELQALKMQLHPHFLFNTLHGISTLIDTDAKSAKAMIVKLSSLLRFSLKQDQSDLIPLREELKFIGEYLDLEKMRFGMRLRVDWSVDEGTRQVLVPQMILQPLVENAIRHGIGSSREAGWIGIEAHNQNTNIQLRIKNKAGTKRSDGAGIGLRNTETRLRHLYSEEAGFTFVVGEDRIAVATITLPALRMDDSFSEQRPLNGSGNEARGHARADY